jgi:predicted transglutaminase-like cysteine proteinase
MSVRGLVVLAVLVGIAAGAPSGPATAADLGQKGPVRLFNTSEVRSSSLRPFPKWTDMLARHLAEEKRGDAPCTPTPFERCGIRKWLDFIATLRGKPPREQLEAVNRELNLHRYVLDIVNYGVDDYWATPREFAVKDGDCEDYAIAKYISLRLLGWEEADLRVVVLQDLNLNVAHAVLAVYLDNDALILDNQTRQVLASTAIRHYRPYYSINESGWWLHR